MYRSQALLSEHRLTHNLQELRKGLPTHTYVMPMLKANAYGHGDILLAPRLSTRNISVVGVANFEEAYRVIGAGFKGQIVCFGAFSRDELTHLPPRTILTLHNFEELQLLKELSSNQREGMCLHLEIDTGMNRLGFRASDKQELLDELSDLQLNVQGIFTHLSESEMADAEFSHYQHSLFEGVAAALEKKWGRKLLRHISNSGSILQFPAYTYDMIRPGIALYGYPPCLSDRNFLPLLEWRAPIAQLKTVEAGESISYNRTYTTQKKMRVATLAVGYGDGYLRAYASAGVTIAGQKCTTLGRICMDYMMVDVTHIKTPLKLGDEAILIHSDPKIGPTAEDLAKTAKTISYEILTTISQRVLRTWTA